MIWDSIVPGFGLRVRPTGPRSFVFNYRTPGGRAGKKRRVTLKSDHPDRARAEAKALAGQHFGGADPAAELAKRRRQVDAPTVRDLLDRFVADHVVALKAKTALEYRRLIERLLIPALGDRLVAELVTADVAAAHQRWRDRPTQAAFAVRVLSSAFSLAEEWGLRPPGSNPARIRLKGARRRERQFSAAEVARMLKTIGELADAQRITRPAALAIRFLFATGCRAGEILDLAWDHVDLDAGVIRWPDTKTGVLTKPITAETAELLAGANRFVGVPWVAPIRVSARCGSSISPTPSAR